MQTVSGVALDAPSQKDVGVLQEALTVVGAGVVGALLAVAAWGPGRSPALALLLPLVWILSPSRRAAFALTATYHLGVSRFLPDFAGVWFGAQIDGYLVWFASSIVCGLAWALFWPSRANGARVPLALLGVLLATMLPPVAIILAGHPFVGIGYLLPGTGWFGVVLFFIGTAALGWALRVRLAAIAKGKAGLLQVVALVLLAVLFAAAGATPDPDAGRVVGGVGAVNSRWGAYPKRGSLEVMQRIGQIGMATGHLAGGEGEIRTVVFGESVLGMYDPSVFPAIKREILARTRRTGQTVVVGADLERGQDLQKVALVFLPDGTSTYVAARQPVPIAEWAPWKTQHSYPASWLGSDTASLGGGLVASVVFCYEEYIPALRLISEWRGKHQMIIAMANLWASPDPLTNSIQASHTEGMARLFARPWVRVVNLAKPTK